MIRQVRTQLSTDWGSLGIMMVLIGIICLVPLAILPFYPDEAIYLPSFLIPSLLSIIAGIGIWLYCQRIKKQKGTLRFPEGKPEVLRRSALIVVMTWLWAILIGSLPFYMGGQLRVVQSLFESVSGWTTTGLSAMDVTQAPAVFLFHRSFMQYCGGLGFVMMMVILTSGRQDMLLFESEGHPDQLMPSLKKTARTVFCLFAVFLILGTIALALCGMSLFDAINHAMCSLSTGGFSTRSGSIGEYSSFPVDFVTIVLMLIGTTNFAVLLLLARGKIRQITRVSEVRLMFGLLALCIPLLALILKYQMGFSWLKSFQSALFDCVSALSTAGFSSMSYSQWPSAAILILIVLMLIGGGMGSTAGGIKLMRIYLSSKAIWSSTRKQIEDSDEIANIVYTRAQGTVIASKQLIRSVLNYIGLYLLVLVIGTLLICMFSNASLTESFFDFSSSLGTVGLSMGFTGPHTADSVLVVEMAGMLLGRLEIIIFFKGAYALLHLFKRSE